MGFENVFGEYCWRCNSKNTKVIMNGYTLCKDCGYIYHTLLDYSHDFEIMDKKLKQEQEDEQQKYGGLRGYSNKYSDKGGFGLDPSFAEEIFNIVKKADTLRENGFSTADGNTFGTLCYILYKVCAEPDDYQKNQHKNRWDDSHPNIIDTLGVYGLNEKKEHGIQLCPDKIKEKYSESIVVLVILHEIMHAAMDTGTFPDGKYWYYKEEAYANAFALKLIRQSGHSEWFEQALNFVEEQPDGYKSAILLLDENISMNDWRNEKLNSSATQTDDQEIWLKRFVYSTR